MRLVRKGLRLNDLFVESLLGIRIHFARSALTSVVAVIGVAALVASMGLTTSSRAEVRQQFDALQGNEIVVSAPIVTTGALPFANDVDDQLRRIPGVLNAGVLWSIAPKGSGVTRLDSEFFNSKATSIEIDAGSMGLFGAVNARFVSGVAPTRPEWRLGVGVVIGQKAAAQLGIRSFWQGEAIYINNIPFQIDGILSSVSVEPELLSQVIVSYEAGRKFWGLPRNGSSVVIKVRNGASSTVAPEAKLELDPGAASGLIVTGMTTPLNIQSEVGSELSGLVLLIGLITLIVSTVTLGGTMLLSVGERTSEIGLRRALGARRHQIATQFVMEGSVLGLFGGALGGYFGVVVSVSILVARHVTAIVSPIMVVCGPLVGLVIGILSSAYPALHASRMEPVTALRR